jgi:hypothetical protein
MTRRKRPSAPTAEPSAASYGPINTGQKSDEIRLLDTGLAQVYARLRHQRPNGLELCPVYAVSSPSLAEAERAVAWCAAAGMSAADAFVRLGSLFPHLGRAGASGELSEPEPAADPEPEQAL